jgi:aryl-alcohol dehydrogenase-like predicted oxidoreductase
MATHVPLGRSGLKISPMCLGTVNFGTSWGLGVEEREARTIIDKYLDDGHNFVDTADNYNNGQSEEIVGRAIRHRRDSVVLATKAAMPTGSGPNDSGLSRIHLIRALNASLRRLGTDYIDLYYCHVWDPDTPIDETMATLDGFVRSGKVRYIGCSNFTASQIVEAQWAVDRLRGTSFIAAQSQYSLIVRDIEADILSVCTRHGLDAVVWSPLAGGILAGGYTAGVAPDPTSRLGKLMASEFPGAREWAAEQLVDRNLTIASEVVKVAGTLGVAPASVALAWARTRPGITAVIIGPRTLNQYEQNVAGFSLDLPPACAADLDTVSGPPPQPVSGRSFRRWLSHTHSDRQPTRG